MAFEYLVLKEGTFMTENLDLLILHVRFFWKHVVHLRDRDPSPNVMTPPNHPIIAQPFSKSVNAIRYATCPVAEMLKLRRTNNP
jgi:hypothetical protein